MARLSHLFVAIFCICSVSTAWKFKLNVPRVLLPLADEGSNFLLHSEGGCFQWSSTRPEVVKVVPTKINDECGNQGDQSNPILATHLEGSVQDKPVTGCTSSAIIRLPPRWGGAPSIAKTQAIVTAEDAHSDGHILRCDVIIDRIHRLQIVTKTLELFLEEAPEEFSVRAYDDQGNEFSSLEGIIFTWSVESASNQEENVKFIKFRDSTYTLEPTLMALEAKGLQGSKVLLEGVRTGSSKVSVRLASKAYADVPAAEVTVMVVANLFLVPHSTFVLSGATVDYHAEQMKSNKIHKIDLTSSQQYYLEVPTDLARNHPKLRGSIVANSVVGATEVILRDNNVGKDDAVKSPSAELHVVAPAYITIDIDPHSNWNVIVGQEYSLHVSVFDSQNHRLFSSSNLVIELAVEPDFFEVNGKTDNGSWIHGVPTKAGTAEVRAVLLGTKDVETGNLVELAIHLKAKAQLEIFDPIVLQPAVSLLPWDPVTKPVTQIAYSITSKQSASFLWTSQNASVATVTQNGIAKTTGSLGETTITAAMNRANHNRGEAVIIVTPVVGLEIIEDQPMEVVTGSVSKLPLSFWGQGSRKFTQCSGIEYLTTVADKTIMEARREVDLQDLSPESCALVSVQGLSAGFSKVTASFSYINLDGKSVKVSDHATVGVFDPLAPVQPFSGSTVLSIGSSVDIVWAGGPLPWIFSPESHFHSMALKDESIAEISEKISTANSFYVYRVTCSKLGETVASLTVGNKKSKFLMHPLSVTSTVTIVCADPNKLLLEASPERPKGPCPLMAKTGRVATLCYENLRINVTVLDAAGRKFDNFSTLDITWSNSDDSLGDLQVQQGVVRGEVVNSSSESLYEDFALARGYQILFTKQKPGSLEITGTLKKSSYLMDRSISDILHLQLVEDAEISPKKLALFHHPESFTKLNIHHGSGYFEVISSASDVAQHKFTAANKSIHLTPGAEGTTTLWARDLCLAPKSTSRATAVVNVIGIHKVELQMVDKVQKGRDITAVVKLWDQFGDLIPADPNNDNYLTIAVTAANKDIATIEAQGYQNREFIVKGATLGHTSLTAVATYGSKRVASGLAPLQVFPPLELDPRNITLIIGSQFQVQVRGGPGQPDASVEFSTTNGKIASTDTAGLISALTLGSLKLTAKAIGTDRSTGKKVVFSSDEVDVHVVKLHGVRIKAPILRMKVGTEMPLTAVGLDHANQNGFSYGSAVPNLNLVWSLSNQDVARLESPFWRNGLSTNARNNGAMRFLAKKPGRTVIKLNAKITAPLDIVGQFQLERDSEVSDHIEVIVFDDLRGRSPRVGGNSLLMAPNSDFQLRTNRDGVSGVTVTYSVLPVVSGQDGSSIVAVTRTGKVTSKRVLGTAVILVKTTEDQAVVQEMSITVHVKPISYLMLNPIGIIRPKTALTTWPLGAKLPLEVSYHDESGSKFDAIDENGMQAASATRPNRFDSNLISSDKKTANHSLSIELTRPGFTVLRTACGPDMDDFLIFDVDSGILPSPRQIGVGDVLVLESLAQGVANENGQWSAEPSGLLHIDSNSGLAVALKSGAARIFYGLADDAQNGLSTNIEIVKAKKVAFQPRDGVRHLTNEMHKMQVVPFTVATELERNGGNLISANVMANSSIATDGVHFAKVLFSCSAKFVKERRGLDLSSIFHVTAGFFQGSYACLFTPYDDSSTFQDQVEITVSPSSSLSQYVMEERIVVPFSSAFRIVTESVLLTNVDPHTDVIITGLDHVLDSIVIVAIDPHFLAVGNGFSNGEDSRGWKVGLKSAYWAEVRPGTDLSITVSSPVTDQSVVIPIKVAFRGDQCANIELGWSSLLYFFASHYQSLMFIIASCVVCVLITRLVVAQANKPQEAKAPGGIEPTVKSPIRLGNGIQSPTLLNADSKPYLWTVNDSPVYGSPTSPLSKRSPRSLSQYSYTDH